jgi:hypothetical protein
MTEQEKTGTEEAQMASDCDMTIERKTHNGIILTRVKYPLCSYIAEYRSDNETPGQDDLDEYDLEHIEKASVERAWFWYLSGCYEGEGMFLYVAAGKWDFHDMGHCSCYGPLENIRDAPRYDSLDDLLSKCTTELQEQLAPCVEQARKDTEALP